MAKREIDYIQLIYDLQKAGRDNKQEIAKILYRYDIPKIESLERRVLEFVFSVTESKLRFKLFDCLAEGNNLPIIHECYRTIYSSLTKEEYIKSQSMNLGKSRESWSIKYELCSTIISQSSVLQETQEKIDKSRTIPEGYEGMKPVYYRYRRKIKMSD